MLIVEHLLRCRASKHVDDVGGAEVTTGLLHTCQQPLGSGGDLNLGGLLLGAAIASIAVVLVVSLAEVLQQRPATASLGRHVADQRLQQCLSLLGFRRCSLFDETLLAPDIAGCEQQAHISWQPVSAGTTDLLVVRLDVVGQIDVQHVTDVGFVDAHTESHGRDHDVDFVSDERRLVLRPHLGREPSVIRQRFQATLLQPLGHRVHVFAGAAVDDSALTLVCIDEGKRLRQHVGLGLNVYVEVWAIEAAHKSVGVAKGQLVADIGLHLRCRGCRQRHTRGVGETLAHLDQLAVLGSEVVTPARNAVCFIDGDELQATLLKQLQNVGLEQRFWRQVQQLDVAGSHLVFDHAIGSGIERAVQIAGRHAPTCQLRDLVFHQRNQR